MEYQKYNYTTIETVSRTPTNQTDSNNGDLFFILAISVIVAVVLIAKGTKLCIDLKAKVKGADDIYRYIFWTYFWCGLIVGVLVETIFKHKLFNRGIELGKEVNKKIYIKAGAGLLARVGAGLLLTILIYAINH